MRIARAGVLVLALCIGVLGGAPALAFSGSGAGTSLNPYQITSCAQLGSINLDLTAHYVLANDIDCSGAASLNGGAGWAPIGGSSGFEGVLDGQGYKIKSLDLSGFADNADTAGMFSKVVNSGVVKNLLVINGKVNGGHDIGMVAGALRNNASLDNVYVQATATCHADNCGGAVGALREASVINNSGADVTVTSTDQSVGGLVGYIAATGVVQKSYANGYVSGTLYVGGLVGAVLTGGSTATVTNSYSSATVDGDEYIGGLLGLGLNVDVTKTYAAGSVAGDNNMGGLVGYFSGFMADTFSAAKITNTTGSGTVGPVTGHVVSATVGNRYFDTNITGFSSSPDGSSPISDSNYFKNNSTNPPFDQWDFSALWRTNYANYPSFAPKIDPYMLCEEPGSTNTSITGTCDVAPLGWGTPTWQARWRIHGTNTWHPLTLSDTHIASATVTGLLPGTWYDLSFQYTNDFGTGPWGTVQILTTGRAPVPATPGRGSVSLPAVSRDPVTIVSYSPVNPDSPVSTDKDPIPSTKPASDSTGDDSTSTQTGDPKEQKKTDDKQGGYNWPAIGFGIIFIFFAVWLFSRYLGRRGE